MYVCKVKKRGSKPRAPPYLLCTALEFLDFLYIHVEPLDAPRAHCPSGESAASADGIMAAVHTPPAAPAALAVGRGWKGSVWRVN